MAQTLFDNIQAKKFYMRLLEVDNNNDIEYKSDIQIKLCEVLQILGDWDECEKMIKEVIDSIKDVSDQKHDWACGELGNLYLQKGLFDDALKLLLISLFALLLVFVMSLSLLVLV